LRCFRLEYQKGDFFSRNGMRSNPQAAPGCGSNASR